jgi:hypothetical protein
VGRQPHFQPTVPHPSPFSFSDAGGPGTAAPSWAPSRCGRAPSRASLPSTRPLSPAAISSPPPRRPELPTLAASGSHPPSTRCAPEEKKKGGEEVEEPFEGATPAPPRGPEAARGVPGHREAKNLTVASPLLPLSAPSSSPLPRRSLLHRRLHLLVAQTVGEHITTLSSCGAWPSSQGRSHPCPLCCDPNTTAPPQLVMSAFKPG